MREMKIDEVKGENCSHDFDPSAKLMEDLEDDHCRGHSNVKMNQDWRNWLAMESKKRKTEPVTRHYKSQSYRVDKDQRSQGDLEGSGSMNYLAISKDVCQTKVDYALRWLAA